jgi:hypothetical protein
MVTTIRFVASGALVYVLAAWYAMFAGTSIEPFSVGLIAAAVAGWSLTFFGESVAELLDLPPVGGLVRTIGVLLLFIPAIVLFAQLHASS